MKPILYIESVPVFKEYKYKFPPLNKRVEKKLSKWEWFKKQIRFWSFMLCLKDYGKD